MNNRLKSGFGFYLILLIVLCLGVYFYYLNSQNTTDEYTVNQFEQDLKAGDVTKIVIKQNEEVPTGVVAASIRGKGTKQFYVSDVTSVVDHVTSDYSDVEVHMTDVDRPSIWVSILPYILMTVVFVFVFFMMTAGAGGGGGGNSRMMNFSKSKAKVIRAEDMDVDFTKVAGLQEEKEEVREIVDFLKEPQRFMDAGARIPKGVIMVGPPGTGKTLLAKAVAGEANVPFFSISGSEFVEMFVGMGAAKVRDLFKQANEKAPCIVFIDEIDTIGKKRDGAGMGGNDEREQTLNQLLTEMDGFDGKKGVVILAATNRPESLDPALLRPGRFDRKISVGKPDVKGRLEILHVHTRDKSLAEDVNLEEIARTTAGFSGADLENLMNESAILAAREQRRFIKKADIDKAIIKVGIGTEKKSRLVPEKERKITAYHETGHAILYHLLPDVGPVYTVSIIPTGVGAAGYTMPLPENDNVFMTKGKMIQDIMVGLGGRIAEELIFDDITTGASQDIKQATAYARAMVTKYGMSEKLGLVNYETQEDDEVFLGRDLGHARPYGEAVAKTIDKEVKAIIDQCYQDAKNIILENMSVLHRCAEELLLKERINQQEFEALFEDTEDAGVQGNGSGDQTEE